jgi:hypothetical protein
MFVRPSGRDKSTAMKIANWTIEATSDGSLHGEDILFLKPTELRRVIQRIDPFREFRGLATARRGPKGNSNAGRKTAPSLSAPSPKDALSRITLHTPTYGRHNLAVAVREYYVRIFVAAFR